ncbi:MAG: hypothetical protein HGA51_04270 [Demequinaceae bacterium]|nr:hypothetical protein [Demequinaceae bacterium]
MSDSLDTQIDLWRAHMERRTTVDTADVDELEDHLRGHIESLAAAGLSEDEAFLVAMKRLGSQDDIAHEFARENSKRLWKQLVLGTDNDERARAGASGWVPAVLFAAAGAAAVRLPLFWGLDGWVGEAYARAAGVIGLVAVVAYLLWRRPSGRAVTVAAAGGAATLAALAVMYPLELGGDAFVSTMLHVPVAAWLLVGLAYVGDRWRNTDGRMDFVRFTGEWVIYLTLLALGGGVLMGISGLVASAAGLDPSTVLIEWILPFGVGGAIVIGAWLVEAKRSVIENMAPVLARVFTPLFAATFGVLLIVIVASGNVFSLDRDLLTVCNAILVLAAGLVLYSLTARSDDARTGWFDWLQVALVAGALALDLLALVNILTRIGDEGWTFNRTVVLGANLILLANLAVSAWLLTRVTRGEAGAVLRLERWQTALLPVYGVWALIVIVALPPAFSLVGG